MTNVAPDEYSVLNTEVLQLIGKLDVSHCVAFGARCCESLLPNYQAFFMVHDWGDPTLLQTALDVVWDWLKHQQRLDYDNISQLLRSMGTIVPALDVFDSIFVWPAIYSVDATSDLLSYLLSGEKHHINNIVALALSAIDQYVRDVTFPMDTFSIPPNRTKALYSWVGQAPILIQELIEQRQTLKTLLDQETLFPDFLDELRQKAQKAGISPLRRGLVVVPKHEI